ncbi:hypothetical protein QFZ97_004898 [Paraburkholderia youngii]
MIWSSFVEQAAHRDATSKANWKPAQMAGPSC